MHRFTVAFAVLSVALTGCHSLVDVQSAKGSFCELYAPIYPASTDSEQTKAQVDRLNRKFEVVCGGDKIADSTAKKAP
ncbi:MAG: hypothetical protein EPO08_00755 [Rhodospirillaceae bacterium]|nr:MAG: hypothetical protein EPO08_00755 [Rhodospirillaceae bacterium]